MAITMKKIETLIDRISESKDILEEYINDKDDQVSNEESKEYPSDERIDKLNEQLQVLQDAFDNLESSIDELQNYET